MAKTEQSIHAKHRQRVYDEVALGGIDHWPEHRVLEYMLFFCIPRGDTNPIAHALIDRFGNLAGVLEASEKHLQEVKGVGAVTARFLHAFPAFDRYYVTSKTKKGLFLKSPEQIERVVLPLFHAQQNEMFYMLLLDERKKLLKTLLLSEGSASVVNVSIAKVVQAATLADAKHVVLAHNHPNQLAIPSQKDVEATGNIMRALGMIEVHVLDHLVVADNDCFSMFAKGVMPYYNMETGQLNYY